MNDVTAAEVSRLEDALLRMCPFRKWDIRQVTFPDTPNTDLDLFHDLQPQADERVAYMVLQASAPTIVYHDRTPDRFPWSSNICRLRASTATVSVTLLLATVASDVVVDPLSTPVDDEGAPLQLFPGAVGAVSQFQAALISDGPSSAFSSSVLGPALELTSPDDAEKDWAIVADTTWSGTNNPRLAFVCKRDAGNNTNFGLAFSSDAADTADTLYVIPDGANGLLHLGDGTGAITGSTTAYLWESVNCRTLRVTGSATLPGVAWTAVSFNAGNFTGSGSMTWTLASGDQTTFAYRQDGKTLFLAFDLNTTTVGGTPDLDLQIAIPGGFTAARQMGGSFDAVDNGVNRLGRWIVQAAGTLILLRRADAANWTASTDNTALTGTILFEIQ
jgi:hypothetical protein